MTANESAMHAQVARSSCPAMQRWSCWTLATAMLSGLERVDAHRGTCHDRPQHVLRTPQTS